MNYNARNRCNVMGDQSRHRYPRRTKFGSSIKKRDVIEIAKNNNELRGIYPFSDFPYDCCDYTCDILGYYLSMHGIETRQVSGEYWDEFTRCHNWLLIDDIVIDITGNQFNKEFGDIYYSKPVYIEYFALATPPARF